MRARCILIVGLVVAEIIIAACTSTERAEPAKRQTELLSLTVGAEDAISGDVAPVDIQAPCLPPVMAGVGRFADVGWVTPRFFLIAENGGLGYSFQPLAAGRSRFRAAFRIPRSEREANAFWDERQPKRQRIAYCDVAGTLERLKDTDIKRLASWPVPFVKVILQVESKRLVMAVSQPTQWTVGGPLIVSADLSADEHASLARDLRDSFGTQISFIVSNRPLEPGCAQTIDLTGLPESVTAPVGLRDGENGGVSPDTLRRVVSTIPDRARRIAVEGTCPDTPDTTLNCDRDGTMLRCRIDGNLVNPHQPGVANVETHTIIGG